ncbi:MAG: lipopolysaccharide biosynthesis protein [Muribaculaceae bacterium]|nr:lipopolysaccharide biosynthesis protein [Muribaculaceae bacterium]MDE6753119.1 lipopolysaccharide biosynthesis protein [Muribaculaceae bacterium]
MRFRTAVIWNVISQFGQSGITMLSTVILARMLTPDDFGLIGIVTIFIAISQMMVDSEMGGSLLRKKDADKTDYSTLFWYNLAVSLLIYIILYISAPYLSSFYHRPELTDVIRLISVCVVIHAFRVVQFIIILRNLQFRSYAVINVVSGVISLIAAIIIAKSGYGYWALVWQPIVVASLIVLLMSLHNRFMPAFVFSRESFRYQFRFGIGLLGGNFVMTIANNISANIIAKISTLQFTGYFTQTNRLTTFCQTSLASIFNQSIFPMMAKFERMEEVKELYHKLLRNLVIGLGGLTVLILLFAPFIIKIALGESWEGAIPIFRILSLTILPASLQVLCRNVMKALGTTKKVLHIDTLISILLILFLTAGSFLSTYLLLWGIVAAQVAGALTWTFVVSSRLDRSANENLMP